MDSAATQQDVPVELPAMLTSEEARVFLRVNRTTFYQLLREGKLPAIKVGRQWRFRRTALLAWIEAQEHRHQWFVG